VDQGLHATSLVLAFLGRVGQYRSLPVRRELKYSLQFASLGVLNRCLSRKSRKFATGAGYRPERVVARIIIVKFVCYNLRNRSIDSGDPTR
jgi:hypothetical protein